MWTHVVLEFRNNNMTGPHKVWAGSSRLKSENKLANLKRVQDRKAVLVVKREEDKDHKGGQKKKAGGHWESLELSLSSRIRAWTLMDLTA